MPSECRRWPDVLENRYCFSRDVRGMTLSDHHICLAILLGSSRGEIRVSLIPGLCTRKGRGRAPEGPNYVTGADVNYHFEIACKYVTSDATSIKQHT